MRAGRARANQIEARLVLVLQKVVDTKYVDPKMNGDAITAEYVKVVDDIKREFQTLTDGI